MVDLQLHLLWPLLAAMIFAAGSLCYKRAFEEGAGLTRAFVLSNVVVGVLFSGFLAVDPKPLSLDQWYRPVAAGALFFGGHLANFLAIRFGDVSLVTPLMGTKVAFVGLLGVLVFDVPLTEAQWWAGGLTTLGIFLLGLTDIRTGRVLGVTTSLALLSALLYATCDLLVQRWASSFGAFNFLALMFITEALLALGLIPLARAPFRAMPSSAWPWLGLAALATALQVGLVASTIAVYKDAMGVNVVYSTRGVWSILLVWFAGGLFGNTERQAAGRRLWWRLAGAILMTVAVALTV